MRKVALLALPLLLTGHPALANSSTGGAALALAALVGARSPSLTLLERQALATMLDGRLNFPWPASSSGKARSAALRMGVLQIR